MKKVVITGVGTVSAYGVGNQNFFSGLAEGKNAIRPIASFDVQSFPIKVAGEVTASEVDLEWIKEHVELKSGVLQRKSAEGFFRDRKVGFGLLAGIEAWQMAKCSHKDKRAGLVLGLGLEQAFLQDFSLPMDPNKVNLDLEIKSILPAIRYRSEIDLCAKILAEYLELKGPVIVNVSACAAGTLAVANAANLIERGVLDIVLTGAADSMINPLGIGGMACLGAMSPKAEVTACRPFDTRRDGLVMGEGAALFVLESEEHALQRRASPIARVLGSASTQDGFRVTAPRPDGAAAQRAMEIAIKKAGIELSDIEYINAHGTGTALNDFAEARAIQNTFKEFTNHISVSSIKGAIGHLMAAAGAIELAASLMAFEKNLLPVTTNHEQLDLQCMINVIAKKPLARKVNALLSNSFGFGGQNATIVLGRP